ncbi:hypothetical protein T265_10480 [Opisthorchis viverrini]|uniref:Uncharacterized protein n=1 Tax=Opisthorchis viverrini TaxID=6198 RepID=A0A074ZD48_OPIVI|nr:hypothetical protein T265_10480 [Opisthorchis viverrini]KER21120.1 hypothetical protein T265_10480 [Opisthorchis viverrini]
MAQVVSVNLLTGRSVVRIRPLPFNFPCLGFGNLTVSQPFQGNIQLLVSTTWLKWLESEFTDRKVCGSNPTFVSRFPCLDLGDLAVSQPSCFLRVAWQLGTGMVLRLDDFFSGLLIAKARELYKRLTPTLLQIRDYDDDGLRTPISLLTTYQTLLALVGYKNGISVYGARRLHLWVHTLLG